ncbi:MAG: hypothetical protein IPF54_13385 [Draconibacterium sp.]|nr:hypothetical protein [Draconibacterium sp.]
MAVRYLVMLVLLLVLNILEDLIIALIITNWTVSFGIKKEIWKRKNYRKRIKIPHVGLGSKNKGEVVSE